MSCFSVQSSDTDSAKGPVVDVDETLKKYCWKKLILPRLGMFERISALKNYDLEVKWTNVVQNSELIEFRNRNKEKSGPLEKRELCLFKTQFKNDSDVEQAYTFKTERQTKSTYAISMQKTIQIGGSAQVSFAVPVNLNFGLSGQFQFTETKGNTFDDTMTWSVDTQIKVPSHTMTTASLIIEEEDMMADVTVENVFTILGSGITIYMRHKKTGVIARKIELPAEKFASVLQENVGFEAVNNDKQVTKFLTKGVFRAVYGAKQIVQLSQDKLQINT